MDAMTFNVIEPAGEADEFEQAPVRDRETSGGGHRRYSAEAVVDVLDPYAAIIDGVPAAAPKP